MRKGEDGRRGDGPRLEGDISVVGGKSGGKWEIQRPGDKWLITAGERERERERERVAARSARLLLRQGRRRGMGANTPRSLGRNAGLHGRETWDGDVRDGPDPASCRQLPATPCTAPLGSS